MNHGLAGPNVSGYWAFDGSLNGSAAAGGGSFNTGMSGVGPGIESGIDLGGIAEKARRQPAAHFSRRFFLCQQRFCAPDSAVMTCGGNAHLPVQAGDAFSKAKLPGLPSGGDILNSAPSVRTPLVELFFLLLSPPADCCIDVLPVPPTTTPARRTAAVWLWPHHAQRQRGHPEERGQLVDGASF